jgi:hypothetical protein
LSSPCLFHFQSITGTGNTNGLILTNGAQVVARSALASLVATNQLTIDGTVYPYTTLAADGDQVIGPKGSSIMRRY